MTQRIRAGKIKTALGTAILVATLWQPLGAAQAAPGPERQLAGIEIFSPSPLVAHKYGNPDQILVGGIPPMPFSPTGAAGGPGAGGSSGSSSGYPGAGGSPGGYPGASGGSSSGYPGASGGYPGSSSSSPGVLPGFSGGSSSSYPGSSSGYPGSSGGYPGSSGSPGSPGGYPGAAGVGGAPLGPPPKPDVTWVYNRPNGGSLEFTISPDGRVIQIRATGFTGSVRTARGVTLGQKYSDVISKYGNPGNTFIEGPIIDADYKDSVHAAFQFYNQKVAGIIVAAVE
ncbi:MAG: DUF2997 domain-containing protein [Armatimonadota bacterium]|nr:DUF2997 domain-containing protein [Armatimonadota bacterium]